jgi:molybdenum cofactor biosynthesis enzyme MoaA
VTESEVSSVPLPEFGLWEQMHAKQALFSFDLEVTARCNNACRHCYIALPAGDHAAKSQELSVKEIIAIAREATSLGALWCLVTGGEPLLREDFPDVYMALKRLGLLVSVFTNACLVTQGHAALFKKYPPRDIEVSVYGVTQETYERVTQKPGSFAAFMRGLDLLMDTGVKVRLKAMALRSNVHELPEIARFCRARTKDYFRFDPLLHLRFDRDAVRNAGIMAERLSPEEIVAIERADSERFESLERGCDKLIVPPTWGAIICSTAEPATEVSPSATMGVFASARRCGTLSACMTCEREPLLMRGATSSPRSATCARTARNSWKRAVGAPSSTCAYGAQPTPTWK